MGAVHQLLIRLEEAAEKLGREGIQWDLALLTTGREVADLIRDTPGFGTQPGFNELRMHTSMGSVRVLPVTPKLYSTLLGGQDRLIVSDRQTTSVFDVLYKDSLLAQTLYGMPKKAEPPQVVLEAHLNPSDPDSGLRISTGVSVNGWGVRVVRDDEVTPHLRILMQYEKWVADGFPPPPTRVTAVPVVDPLLNIMRERRKDARWKDEE